MMFTRREVLAAATAVAVSLAAPAAAGASTHHAGSFRAVAVRVPAKAKPICFKARHNPKLGAACLRAVEKYTRPRVRTAELGSGFVGGGSYISGNEECFGSYFDALERTPGTSPFATNAISVLFSTTIRCLANGATPALFRSIMVSPDGVQHEADGYLTYGQNLKTAAGGTFGSEGVWQHTSIMTMATYGAWDRGGGLVWETFAGPFCRGLGTPVLTCAITRVYNEVGP